MTHKWLALLALVSVACSGGGDAGIETQDWTTHNPNNHNVLYGAGDCQLRDEASVAARGAYVNNVATAIDLASCQPLQPTGANCVFSGQVKDFEDDVFKPQLAGTRVRVFLDNTVQDINVTCTDCGTFSGSLPATGPCAADANLAGVTCLEGKADATGRIDFPVLCDQPVATWAFREPSGGVPVTKAAIEFLRVVRPTTGVLDLVTISISTYNLIPTLVGFSPDPRLGIVAGAAEDCARNNVSNVTAFITAGLVDAPPDVDFCSDAAIDRVGTFYFDAASSLPSKEQTLTNTDGLFAFVNVPPGPVTVFGYGRAVDGDPISELGHVQLASLPDTITIANLPISQ